MGGHSRQETYPTEVRYNVVTPVFYRCKGSQILMVVPAGEVSKTSIPP